MKQRKKAGLYIFINTLLFVAFLPNKIFAAKAKKTPAPKVTLPPVPPSIVENGQVIQFGTIDNLLWSIIATIQAYTLPIMAIAIALLGIKLVMSGDDTAAKDNVKSWIAKILVGGVLIFGASTIATLIKGAVGG